MHFVEKLLIYIDRLSPRLEYVLNYIFRERLHIDYECTLQETFYIDAAQPKLAYTDKRLPGLCICPTSIMYEQGVHAMPALALQRWKHVSVLFYNQPGAIIPFDIFAATFFMISRYEEYLPHQQDRHGRFPHTASVAYQYGFHEIPVVDYWLMYFKEILASSFQLKLSEAAATSMVTIDIDMLYQYAYKPTALNVAGIIKNVLTGKFSPIIKSWQYRKKPTQDPFFCFKEIESIVIGAGIPLQYFILTTEHTSRYDRNTIATHPAFSAAIQSFHESVRIGIHPSYHAINGTEIEQERHLLSQVIQQSIQSARMHYIKLAIPQTYQAMLSVGIQEDYSMGWASINGFRAGTSLPYQWYDIASEQVTDLKLYPFCFMDATSIFYLQQQKEQIRQQLDILLHHINVTKGMFISIWHNYILGDTEKYPFMMSLFQDVVATMPTKK